VSNYTLIFAPAVAGDFNRISDYLFRSYIMFGEAPVAAADHV
jgi:hypothetical protein